MDPMCFLMLYRFFDRSDLKRFKIITFQIPSFLNKLKIFYRRTEKND